MNKDQFSGQWKILKGKVKEKWGKLTDDDITKINGKRDQLSGLIQKKYGYDKERVEEELSEWEDQYSDQIEEMDIDRDEGDTRSQRKYG